MANNIWYAYSWLVDRGFAPNAAAGIVGNLVQESGVNPHSNQVGGPGRGIAQWSEGERWSSLVSWANKNGKNIYDLDTQLQWMLIEMNGYGITDRMKKMNNLEAATRLFMNVFERPDPAYANLSGRIQFARNVRERDPNVPTSAKKDQGGGGDGGGGNNNGGGGDPGYGTYGYNKAFLKDHPQVAALIEKAQKQDWTPERLSYEIKETAWWQQRTESQKKWELLQAEQPKEAKDQIDKKAEDIETAASQMGVDLSGKDTRQLAERALRWGLTENQVLEIIGRQFEYQPRQEATTGEAGLTVDAIKAQAEAFGVRVDNQRVEKMVRNVLQGDMTVEGLVDRFREQAKVLYAGIAPLLDGGQTTRDIMEPYLSIAADELGIPLEQMRTSDPRWTKVLNGENGQPMNSDQWLQTIRTDRQYGWDDTDNAREQAAGLRAALAQKLGAA